MSGVLGRDSRTLAHANFRAGVWSALDDRQQELNQVVAAVEVDLRARRVTIWSLRQALERRLDQPINRRRVTLKPLACVPATGKGSILQSEGLGVVTLLPLDTDATGRNPRQRFAAVEGIG